MFLRGFSRFYHCAIPIHSLSLPCVQTKLCFRVDSTIASRAMKLVVILLLLCVLSGKESSSISYSSFFEAPWSFTLNASETDTCTNLRGNVSTLCFVRSSSAGGNTSAFTLILLISSYAFNYHNPQAVWAANRQTPVSDGAKVELGQDGNLALYEANGTRIWSSNTLQKGISSIQIDADYQGSLALKNSSNGTVWSTFDFPTDTIMQYKVLLPGDKLVSNLSSSDPSEGPYSLVLEPGGFVLYFDTGLGGLLPYWTWGYYGFKDLRNVLHTCEHPIDANFQDYRILFSPNPIEDSNSTSPELCNVSQADTDYADYFNPQEVIAAASPLGLAFLRVEADGALRSYSWSGNGWLLEYDPFGDQCLLPNRCGPYGMCTSSPTACSCPQNAISGGVSFTQNSTGIGCVPLTPLSFPTSCNLSNTTSTTTFLELTEVEYFPNQYLPPDLASVSVAECKAACLKNCSCKATFYYNESRSCYFASDQLWTMHKTNNQNHLAFIKVEISTNSEVPGLQSTSSDHNKVVAISISLGLAFTLVMAFLFIYWVKSSKGVTPEDEAALRHMEEQDLDTIKFKRFTFKELHDATSGFTSRRLGAGGFGEVFEGQLLGRTVAVKRLKNDDSDNFRAEVEAMGTVNHVNLVHLEGFCAEESHRLLVYEYMSNGSLDTWIFNQDKSLPWDVRLQIAKGTADCLVYLHEQCRNCILHLDIKPQNVLVDGKFCAKVSDFGLSKLLSRYEATVSPMHVRGTRGYIAPELFDGRVATPKADVYSFGMVLWELVSGQKVLEPHVSNAFRPEQAFPKVELGAWDEVIDPALYREVEHDERRLLQVKNTMRLAYWCIQYDQDKRPTMSSLSQQLHSGQQVPTPPLSRTLMSNWADFLSSVNAASIIQAISLSYPR